MFMIKKNVFDFFSSSYYYLGLSSIVLFMFLFPFSNTSLLNCEDKAASDCDDHQVQSEAVDSEGPSEQEELSTEESEYCFEQHTHFDSIFEEWRRVQHQDGSYSYEYGYRYAYNYNYSYRYNLDKCIGPLPAPYPPNQAPIQPPLPHDGNPYPASTP